MPESRQVHTVGEELTDVLFNIICMVTDNNIDLDKEFKRVIDKFNTRDKDRFKKK